MPKSNSNSNSNSHSNSLRFIFITVVLDVLAFGVTIPVLPRLIEQFVGGDTAHAARIFGWFGTVWALMQFLSAPVLGALSDRFGRRPVILISLFGLGLDYILMALAPSLRWLVAGRIVSGATAANSATAGAYIADVTPPEGRAAGYGMIGAAWGVGFVLGPALGGLVGEINPRLPFWVAGILTLLNVLYGVFVLPESLPKERRRPFTLRQAHPAGSFQLLRSKPGLVVLAGAYFLHYLAHQALPAVFVLYAGFRYHWDARAVGLTLTVVGISSMIVQGGLIKPIVARLGERRAMFVGLACEFLSYLGFGLAPTPLWLIPAIVIGAFAGLFGPSANGLMSRQVDGSEQGRLQGATSGLMALANLTGPWIFATIFAYFITRPDPMPRSGAPFLVAAAIVVVALLVTTRTPREPTPS